MQKIVEGKMEKQIREIALLIDRQTVDKKLGQSQTKIDGLKFFRANEVAPPIHTLYNPSLCMVAQGSKLVMLAEESYIYSPSNYLVASVHFPIRGQILEATQDKPFLSLQLDFEANQIFDIVKIANLDQNAQEGSKRGLILSDTPSGLLDAVLRLIRLLDEPEDIPILAPIFIQEILYHVLKDKQGAAIRQFAITGTHAERIAKVITVLNHDFAKPLPIEKLAKIANMSSSSLHFYFKKVTSMSPLQYQKYLRLQEARRLLVSDVPEAANAAFQVGYENPSQFNREYVRMYGLPPITDMKRMRETMVSRT